MSSNVAIRIDGVGKTFAIYDKPHHRLLQQLFPRSRRWHREFHALRNVSLEVRRGETVGIVGRNGSGKSTLLQIICGTLSPSAGRVEVNGRVAALLELGAGFNPEFTGRENAYLNGAVLGLSRAEIDARFADIAAFADIGEFIEQPVKTYSSGMYVRLAFAVAIHVDPDILVVDEALAVGDEAFQRKCFARIERMRADGVTVLFVSHSAGTVVELCNRAMLLDQGECLLIDAPKAIVTYYHKLIYAPSAELEAIRSEVRRSQPGAQLSQQSSVQQALPEGDDAFLDPSLVPDSTLRYAARGVEILDARIETLGGKRVNVLRAGRSYVYCYAVRFDVSAWRVRCGMLIKTISGLELGGAVTSSPANAVDAVESGTFFEVRFRFDCMLAPGTYFLNAGVLGVVGEGEEFLDRLIDVAMFRVQSEPERLATALVDFAVSPELRILSNEEAP